MSDCDSISVPQAPVQDLLLKEEVTLRADGSGCAYQGYEFGAHYPDSVCIQGMLWDADSGEADGDGWRYSNGGDIPCPHCNHVAWAECALEDAGEKGFNDGCAGKSVDDCPYPAAARFLHLGAQQAARWRASHAEALAADEAEAQAATPTTA